MPVISNLTPAYILHRYPYRETSLLLDCFVNSIGRMSLIARGARRHKKSGTVPFQCFTPLMMSWYGRNELKTLTHIETFGVGVILSGDSLACGFYINELLLRLCKPYEPHEQLFQAYANALYQLTTEEKPACVLREFEFILLAEIGFEIDFTRDHSHNTILDASRLYHYLPAQGFVMVNTLQEGQMCFSGATLQAIAARNWSQPGILAAAKRLTRLALAPLLGEKPLKARTLLK